jgi:hypothetical protein
MKRINCSRSLFELSDSGTDCHEYLTTFLTTTTTCFPRTTRLLSSLTRNGKESETNICMMVCQQQKEKCSRGTICVRIELMRRLCGCCKLQGSSSACRIAQGSQKLHGAAAQSLCDSVRRSHSGRTRGSGPKGRDPEDITIEDIRNEKVR